MPVNELLPAGLPIMPDQTGLKQLSDYLDMLVTWNRALNLVGCDSRRKIATDLLADSFHLASFLENIFPPGFQPLVADLGAGAGLPGIPLRIVWDSGNYTMVEIREKRALFLANVLSRLGLKRTRVFRGAAENFFARNLGMDCILGRAFLPWPQLLQLAAPHLNPHGFVVIMANQEMPAHVPGWEKLGHRAYDSGNKKRWFWALKPAFPKAEDTMEQKNA